MGIGSANYVLASGEEARLIHSALMHIPASISSGQIREMKYYEAEGAGREGMLSAFRSAGNILNLTLPAYIGTLHTASVVPYIVWRQSNRPVEEKRNPVVSLSCLAA